MDNRPNSGGDAFMSDKPSRLDQQTIPAEIRRWNWGAFFLNWIWGIYDNLAMAAERRSKRHAIHRSHKLDGAIGKRDVDAIADDFDILRVS